MTPAIKSLEDRQISYKLHQYQHESHGRSFGEEAVEKLAVDAKRVFKTLAIETDKHLAIAIIPVSEKLSLKLAAKALAVKKVKMADAAKVVASTGYVLGGVSPLGQKRLLTTLLDSSAFTHKSIYISGGKRGLEIELSPSDLQQICQAKIALLC